MILTEKIENYPNAFWCFKENIKVGQVFEFSRFRDWAWSKNIEKVGSMDTYGIAKSKEEAIEKLIKIL